MKNSNVIDDKTRVLFFINGFGLLALSLLIGWVWFFALLERIVLWPLPIDISVNIPNDSRAWRMAHMEAITQGLMLIGVGATSKFLSLRKRQTTWLFWSAIIAAWVFTVAATLNAIFGTRGLAFGGGPFEASTVNDLIYLMGYPPIIGIHIMIILIMLGLFRTKSQLTDA